MSNQEHKSLRPGAQACLALLAVALVAGCGGGGGSAPLSPNEARLSAASGGGVVAYFKSKIAQRAASGLNGTAITVPTVGGLAAAGSVVANTGASLLEPATQEDELLKAEGNRVYALHRAYLMGDIIEPARLSALGRLADGSLQRLGNVTLAADYIPSGLYVANAGARVAVLSQQDPYAGRQPVTGGGAQLVAEYSRKFSLDLFSAGNGSVPAQTNRIRVDGLLLGSRLIGNTLYVVSTWSPDLTRFNVPAGSSAAAAETALAGLDAAAILPTVQVDGGAAQPLVAETGCFLPPSNASLALQLTTITAIDLASSNLARDSRCFIGGSEGLYLAPASVYLASSRQYRYGSDVSGTVFPAGSRTDIHKFALQATQAAYRGSASVAGHLGWDAQRMPQRMSEYQGDLRVLSFSGETGQSGTPPVTIQSKPASPALVTVLRENAGDLSLTALATLPNTQRPAPLARAGQQVDTLHFAGPRAYAGSLLRTDPLQVLDLSAPADPRIAGEVAAAGYADHLVPLGSGLLLGIGKDASVGGTADGIRLALFNVTDPAQPRRLATETLGIRGSLTALGTSRPVINIQQQGQRIQVAFPARVYEPPVTSPIPPVFGYQGLARYEVNTAAGTLTALRTLASTELRTPSDMPELDTRYNLANERGLQIDSAVYYLSGGQTYYMVGF